MDGPEKTRCHEAFKHSLSQLIRAFHKLGLSRERLTLTLRGRAAMLESRIGVHRDDKDREDAF